MILYNLKCTKCNYKDSNKSFETYNSFKNYKCPKCNNPVQQVYESMKFKIKGYCYENEVKGLSLYRDIGKNKKSKYNIKKGKSLG